MPSYFLETRDDPVPVHPEAAVISDGSRARVLLTFDSGFSE